MTTTTNMALVLATVSETLGPEWATMLNTLLQRVDLHDHTEGNGAKVTPAGLEINDTLDLGDNYLDGVLAVSLAALSVLVTAKTGSLQRVGSNLWWINSAGASVQITNGTSLATPGTGAIAASVISSYPYTVLTSDAQAVLVIDSSAARTLTLPAATNAMFLMVKDGGGAAQTNNITITPDGTDLIDGSNSSYLIDANYGSVGLVSDGVSKWYVV